MYRVSLRIIFIVALCTAVLSHAEPGYCFLNSRECEDLIDSVEAARLPDSLRTTLQEKLDSDTGFVFWGNADKPQWLRYKKNGEKDFISNPIKQK